ncbi:hypothetical protein [Jannaschia sp. CCS1]|uniref:hypothetical protein n=1 Tax=Jannaschia sp. (strain CCS1) TaxID=290400 RepID=UPI000053BD0D|nr:hypothetical protein [Jannaschia sp. CCS1]ABD54795.1 hypothetical protein Jann_1878 [Jannaschia sp. CCS1]
MKRQSSPVLIGLGFLGLGVALLAFAAVLTGHVTKETRIGRGLLETGEVTRALLVTADRMERTQCSRSQRRICTAADNFIGTVVYQVPGRRSGADIRLTPDEFEAYIAGEEVFIDLIYLPAFPTHVERIPGARLANAGADTLTIYVMAAFGLTLALIGGVAMRIARKQTARPSTGPQA